MASSSQSKTLQAALVAQAAKKMQIEAFMKMIKQAREELKQCNELVKREKELDREHKKRLKEAAGGGSSVKTAKKAKTASAAGKKKKKTPKSPNFKRPRGGAPKSEIHNGLRKVWDYDNGGWKEPVVEESVDEMDFSDADDA